MSEAGGSRFAEGAAGGGACQRHIGTEAAVTKAAAGRVSLAARDGFGAAVVLGGAVACAVAAAVVARLS